MPPKEIADILLAPRHENYTLSNLSPDGRLFLITHSSGLVRLEDLARPIYNFAGERIDVSANRSRGLSIRGAVAYELYDWNANRRLRIEAPRGSHMSGADWSPDGRSLMFLAHQDTQSTIYVADTSTGAVKQVSNLPVMASLVTRPSWTGDGRIVTVLVPNHRMAVPQNPAVPAHPLVRTSERANRQRTHRTLLQTAHDMAMLEFAITGQLAIIDPRSGSVHKIGQPAMISSVDPSPDGKFFRVTTVLKPFSYVTSFGGFGRAEEIWDLEGKAVAEISRRSLGGTDDAEPGLPDFPDFDPSQDLDRWLEQQDEQRRAQERPEAKRSLAWRPDGNGLSFLQQEPARQGQTVRKDRVMQWLPPYGNDSERVIYESERRIGSVRYSADCQTLFLTESEGGTDTLYMVRLSEPSKRLIISTNRTDDFYTTPGSLMTTSAPNGTSIVRISPRGTVFLSGTQYFRDPEKDAPRPFIDEVTPGDEKNPKRIWQSSAERFETVSAVLNDEVNTLMVTRQSPTEVPNSFLVETGSGNARQMTQNRDFAPAITQARRYRIQVTRPDGIKFWVRVTAPSWSIQGSRLPAMFWFYPREYTDQRAYDRSVRTHNKNTFPTLGNMSIEYLVTQGYAVVQPDAPIIGPTGRMNDNYIPDLRNNLAAVIDYLDREGFIDRYRLGLGGHSYGAFSTANAMIHTPFFRAGIAGAGNYNRLLTPMAFQSEQRLLWDARETYMAMSPLLYANQMTGAFLMYHGMDDHNVGTHPINSERMFHALQGLGKPTALYLYPYEDHGQQAQETLLDLWARWTAWLDRHVKHAGQQPTQQAPAAADGS
jgi:dipeptidyl aminopeptidase/acylaminoacyl peptidase